MAQSLLMRPYLVPLARTPLFRRAQSVLLHHHTKTFVSQGSRSVFITSEKIQTRGSSNYQTNGLTLGDGLVGRRFSIGASLNDSGSTIDSPLMQSMENKIKEQLNAEFVAVKDAYGDGRHVSINVVSSAFEGQSAVNRQRMVYKAIWEELQNTVHAVDEMSTKTPSEAAAK